MITWQRSPWHEDRLAVMGSYDVYEIDVFPSDSSRDTWLWVIRTQDEIVHTGSTEHIHTSQTAAERCIARELL